MLQLQQQPSMSQHGPRATIVEASWGLQQVGGFLQFNVLYEWLTISWGGVSLSMLSELSKALGRRCDSLTRAVFLKTVWEIFNVWGRPLMIRHCCFS